jgi:hypothetical protein
MNSNHVGANYPDSFGNYVICSASAVPINAVSNTAAVMSVQGTSYIVRRVTITNANASCATANVSILTTSDGATANAIFGTTQLSNVTSSTTYQDIAPVANAASNVYSSGALYLKVTTAVNATVDVSVYGDIVNL